jgi:hypothetical protein
MTVRYCTLFDRNYATRGLVMLDSLRANCDPSDEIVVLALDQESKRLVEAVDGSDVRVIELADMEDAELLAVEKARPRREFCWTCTPALSAWMARRSALDDVVIYVDADLMFFRDPRVLLQELHDGGSMLIHEHRFSADRVAWEPDSGRFNVGFVAFRIGDEARRCVELWRAQTIECCERDPARGLCGDQHYLTEWPELYPSLRIMHNIGGGVAPWNVNQYRVARDEEGPTVNGWPIVFYHYHALSTLHDPSLKFIEVEPANGYDIPLETREYIYRPYVRRLGEITYQAIGARFPVLADKVVVKNPDSRGPSFFRLARIVGSDKAGDESNGALGFEVFSSKLDEALTRVFRFFRRRDGIYS